MLIIPAILEDFRSLKDKTLKVNFSTNELSPEQILSIAQSTQQFGFLAFNKDTFTAEQKEAIEGLKSDYEVKEKSPSKRLRNVLYLNWKDDPQGFETAEEHYIHQMERLIAHFKNKLD